MALDKRRAVEIRDVWGEFLQSLDEINVVHFGDPRKDLEPTAAIVQFDFPDTVRRATGGYRHMAWSYATTFAFDATDWNEPDELWCLISVQLLNAESSNRNLGTNYIQGWGMEDLAPPDTMVGQNRGNPTMFKAIRSVIETEEY